MKNYLPALVALVLFAVSGPGPGTAGAVGVVQTGQTTCYDGGNLINCKGTGQDGEIQAGIQSPDPRFKDNGNGTVTDTLTGLMWLKDAECFDHFQDWKGAIDKVETFNANPTLFKCLEYTAGYSDWVLPNINELESLTTYGHKDGLAKHLKDSGFIEVMSGTYLSSTHYAGDDADYAFDLNMDGGTINLGGGMGFIWPVRGKSATVWATGKQESIKDKDDGQLERGVEWPSPRCYDNGDGTVTDILTGLMWLKDAKCLGTHNWANALYHTVVFNSDPGLYKCKDYTAGYSDWHLPNVKELESLLSRAFWAPPVASYTFPGYHQIVNIQKSDYWSSTTDPILTDKAFTISMNQGTRNAIKKNESNAFVLPVRSKAPGESGNKLTLSPSSHSYGEITVSQISPAQTFTVMNVSGAEVFIENIMVTEPDCITLQYTLTPLGEGCKGKTLKPSETCEVAVAYTPASAGKRDADLVVAAGSRQLTAHLSGEGVGFQTYTVTVIKAGPGNGEITGGTSSIACGDDGDACTGTYPQGSGVFLSPAPGFGAVFEGWSSPCYMTGTSCYIDSLEGDVTVVGTFGLETGADAVPLPGITANGSDTQVTVDDGTDVSIEVSLNPGGKQGEYADWWIWAETSGGNVYFDAASNQWLSGDGVTFQGALFGFDGYKILNMPLPKGTYIVYFVVELKMNGIKDGTDETVFSDEVRITVN